MHQEESQVRTNLSATTIPIGLLQRVVQTDKISYRTTPHME